MRYSRVANLVKSWPTTRIASGLWNSWRLIVLQIILGIFSTLINHFRISVLYLGHYFDLLLSLFILCFKITASFPWMDFALLVACISWLTGAWATPVAIFVWRILNLSINKFSCWWVSLSWGGFTCCLIILKSFFWRWGCLVPVGKFCSRWSWTRWQCFTRNCFSETVLIKSSL